MLRSRHVTVTIDLAVIQANARQIAERVKVPLIAVVKADGYGVGAKPVSRAIASLVSAFYVFDLAEAAAADLGATGLPTIALRAESHNPDDYLRHRVRPVVWDIEAAAALRETSPVLSVDTGQQRFGVPADRVDEIDQILAAGAIDEAFTHATTVAQATRLEQLLRGKVSRLHAAATALLNEPAAILDAVRPGLALYRGAAKVTAPLVETRDAVGPAGYTGFRVARHGVILAGYSNGLRAGAPCRVAGQPSRVLEVGMQSAFVECPAGTRIGDEVVLLGDGVAESDIAEAWKTSAQEALLRMTSLGERRYLNA